MANFVSSRSKAFRVEGLVMALFCLLAASCDLPPGPEKGKGSLTITLPGAKAPGQNSLTGARAVHLPEPITDNMSYTLDFYNSGSFIPIGPTRDKVITVELEPGYWDIAVTAYYGSGTAIAALDKKPQVEIRAGQANSISFTMNADEFITPKQVSWGNDDVYIGTGNSAPTLLMEIDTTSPELSSAIPGWTDNFLYQRYYKDSGGNPTNLDSAAVPFPFPSSPNPLSLALAVNNTVAGTFSYYVDVINAYTYTSEGTTATGKAVKHIHVGDVTVVAGTVLSIGGIGPGGGTIFYVGADFTVNGQTCNYLEAGPVLGLHQWSSNTDPTGATGDDIGTGWTNTETIINALNDKDPNSAAHIARAYNGGGLSDWFLPSRGELQKLRDSNYFGSDTPVWTSTEYSYNPTMAIRIRTTGSTSLDIGSKTSQIVYVRPIRAF